MKLENSQTFINLAKDFAGECQARTRYKFIEYGARKEGFNCLADVIDKVVFNEFNHARMFYTKIQEASDNQIDNIDISAGYPFKEKWNLLDNLKIAMEDEKAEVELYPQFAETAREEGFKEIAILFDNIAGIENCHMMLFKELYTQLKDGTMYKKSKPVKWKCGDCGYEATSKQAFSTCPVCGEKQGDVLLILKDE